MSAPVTNTIDDINLAELVHCPSDVRRTGAGAGIAALAVSIQAHGLLQSLVVRPKLNSQVWRMTGKRLSPAGADQPP